jgi:hypothetical protein
MARSSGNSRFTALVLALVAAPVALMAQSNTTSALSGVVKDPQGRPLAGALVRLSSPSLIGGERTVRSTENGSYRFAVLPPGKYRIVVEFQGFTTLVGNDTLELGRSSTLNWKFASGASATIEVVSADTSVDTASVNLTQNFKTEELATLPTDRSIGGIMNLTPGVNSNAAWGGNRRENAYMMDGINISDPSGGTVWIFPNPDWFSEIQVGGIGASAEYGSFNGGFVNGLIKRGGNDFSGSVNAYYGDTKWQAKSSNSALDPADKEINPAKDWDVAFNLGGPIIKDKLWFFLSVERIQADESRPGALVPYTNGKLLGLGKLTWQVTPNATLEFLAEYDYMKVEHRGIDKYTLPVASVQEISPDRTLGVTWTQTLGADKVLTLKAMGFSGRYDLLPYNGNAKPLDAYDTLNGIEYYNNTLTADWNYRSRVTASATFDWFKTGLFSAGDSHAFKFGIEREQAADEELEITPGGAQLNAYTDVDSLGNPALFTDYFMTGGGWNIRQRVNRMAAFVQDEWKLNERLTIRPGLRYERFQGRYYGADSNLWDKSTLAPRFGFNLALTSDLSDVLKGHWGRYYAGYSTFFIDRAIQSAIPKEVYYYWGAPADGYYGTQIDPLNAATWPVADPNDPANTPYQINNNLSTVDPNAKQPYTEETTLSYDHKFSGPMAGWTLSASWVYRQFKDTIVRKDLADDSEGYWRTYTNPLNGGTINAWVSGIAQDAAGEYLHQYVITNDSRAKRRYTAASVTMDRKLANGWSFNGTYTRAQSTGNVSRADGYDDTFASPNNQINADGKLPGTNKDEFKARGLVELPWNLKLSGTFTYLSGTQWTPYYRTGYIPTRQYIYTEIRGSERYPSRRLLDLRLTESINLPWKAKADVFVEVFNVLNSGSTIAWTERINSAYYLYPSTVETGRRLRLGFRLNF